MASGQDRLDRLVALTMAALSADHFVLAWWEGPAFLAVLHLAMASLGAFTAAMLCFDARFEWRLLAFLLAVCSGSGVILALTVGIPGETPRAVTVGVVVTSVFSALALLALLCHRICQSDLLSRHGPRPDGRG